MEDNVQIYPSRERVEPNDKATKILFSLTKEEFHQLIETGARCGVTEKKKSKKHGKIRSTFQLANENGYTQIIQLDEFDRAVLSVCISEWDFGNRYTTPDIIYRGLTGKTARKARPSVDQYAAILQSVDKLMCTLYDPQIIEAYSKMKYDTGEIEKIVKAPLLPCERHQKSINGQIADIICFTAEPALLRIASTKKQIIRYPIELLDVPNQNNNPKIIAIKNYVLRRVFEIKSHKMTPVITLEDIYRKTRLTSATKLAKLRANDYILGFFEHLKELEVIKEFERVQKVGRLYGIKISK